VDLATLAGLAMLTTLQIDFQRVVRKNARNPDAHNARIRQSSPG
jgi:hypothetical protein